MIEAIDMAELESKMADSIRKGQEDLNRKYPGRRVWKENGEVVVCVPVQFRTRNGKRRILAPDGQEQTPRYTPLVEAIARAWQWQDMYESGQYATITELADAVGLDRRYVARTLELTSLAPDIVEAILAGNEPQGMSLNQLYQGIPVRWDEQRELLGFPAID